MPGSPTLPCPPTRLATGADSQPPQRNMTVNTTPSNSNPLAKSPMAAADIRTASAEIAACVAGAHALIRPFMKEDDDIEAAGMLLHNAACMLAGLSADCMEGVEA